MSKFERIKYMQQGRDVIKLYDLRLAVGYIDRDIETKLAPKQNTEMTV